MQVRVWGCRGSLAAPGPETLRYGGNTSCIEVRLGDGTLIVLDAGTGIRPFGVALHDRQRGPIHVFLTHLHLDHLGGLAFFGPLWSPEVELHIYGPPSPIRSLEQRIAQYFSPPLFPVHISEIPSHPTFHDVPDEEWEVGSARISATPVSHRGPTLGYRIEENERSLAYIPDHEPALGIDLGSMQPEWISGHGVARGADVLVHDAQYTEEEYRKRIGWGHSSIAHVVDFARAAGAKHLVMFHHDPLHSDDELEAMLARVRQLSGADGVSPELAREGMEFSLG